MTFAAKGQSVTGAIAGGWNKTVCLSARQRTPFAGQGIFERQISSRRSLLRRRDLPTFGKCLAPLFMGRFTEILCLASPSSSTIKFASAFSYQTCENPRRELRCLSYERDSRPRVSNLARDGEGRTLGHCLRLLPNVQSGPFKQDYLRGAGQFDGRVFQGGGAGKRKKYIFD